MGDLDKHDVPHPWINDALLQARACTHTRHTCTQHLSQLHIPSACVAKHVQKKTCKFKKKVCKPMCEKNNMQSKRRMAVRECRLPLDYGFLDANIYDCSVCDPQNCTQACAKAEL